MDVIIYIIIVAVLGIIKMRQTIDVEDTGCVVESTVTVPQSDLPYASNLELKREYGAYTLILEELGLK